MGESSALRELDGRECLTVGARDLVTLRQKNYREARMGTWPNKTPLEK